jgi:hypothetical protein
VIIFNYVPPPKDGPVDYWKKPSDWDKKTTWEKIKWYIGKIGGALASGI